MGDSTSLRLPFASSRLVEYHGNFVPKRNHLSHMFACERGSLQAIQPKLRKQVLQVEWQDWVFAAMVGIFSLGADLAVCTTIKSAYTLAREPTGGLQAAFPK
jgi:hypothetical protein